MKFLASIILLLTSVVAFGQEVAEDNRTFRIGLKASPNLSWLKEDKIETEQGKMGLGLNYGLETDILISNNLWVSTGMNINTFGGGYNANLSDTTSRIYLFTETDTMQMVSRRYTFSTVTLPLTVKMKTKEVGYITYWGQFGLNVSYAYKARATKNRVLINNLEGELDDREEEMDIIDDSNPIRLDLNIGLGGEYSLVGNTSLLFGLNWENGILRSLKKNSEVLLLEEDGNLSSLPQQVKSNSIVLSVGILF